MDPTQLPLVPQRRIEEADKDPNYLVVSTLEFTKLGNSITDRAGIMLSICVIVITTLLLLKTEFKDYTVAQTFYQFMLPILFLVGAFCAYLHNMIKRFGPVPYDFLYHRAQERSLSADSTGIDELSVGYEFARKSYRRNRKWMFAANSMFVTSFGLLLLVNLITPTIVEEQLLKSTAVGALNSVSILLLLIGILASALLYHVFGDRNDKPFGYRHVSIDHKQQTFPLVATPIPAVPMVPIGLTVAGQPPTTSQNPFTSGNDQPPSNTPQASSEPGTDTNLSPPQSL